MEERKQYTKVVLLNDEKGRQIRKFLKPQAKKSKKKKTIKEEYLIQTGKKRMRKQPSKIAETTLELIKQKITDPSDIASFMEKQGRKIDTQQQNLYAALVSSKVMNGKFILNDDLANRPFKLYCAFDGYMTDIISNDWLWLALMFNRLYTSAKNTWCKDEHTRLMYKNAVVDTVHFTTPPFLCNAGKEIKKGYYQDFHADFSCVGMVNGRDENILDTILNGNGYDFVYQNAKYTVKGDNNECIICKPDITLANARKMVKACKIISLDDRKLDLKEKVYQLKSEKVRFIDCKVKPERFCPAFLQVPENINFTCFIEARVDYNTIFQSLDDSCKATKKIVFYANSWYWTNTESWFDFLRIYTLTSTILPLEQKSVLIGDCDFYIAYKDIIDAWGVNQLNLQKILIEFYNSFISKINWDKVTSLHEKIKNYIEFRDYLTYDESYSKIKAWIQDKYYCNFIKRQFSDEIFKLADKMFAVLTSIVKKRDTVSMVENLKIVGVLIFLSSLSSDNPENMSFPFIVSSGAIMGELTDNADLGNPLKENVDRLMKQAQNSDINDSALLDSVSTLLSNINQYREMVVKGNVQKVSNDNSYGFNNEEIDYITKQIMKDLETNNQTSNILNRGIMASLRKNGNLNDLVFNDMSFNKYIEQFALKKRQNELNNQQRALELQRQQNQLDMKKNELSSQSNAQRSNEDAKDNSGDDVFFDNGYSYDVEMNQKDSSNITKLPGESETSFDITTKARLKNFPDFKTIDHRVRGDQHSNWSTFTNLIDQEPKYLNDHNFVKYYADIVFLSDFYDDVKDVSILYKYNDVGRLSKSYPILPSVFEAVVLDNKNIPIPTPENIKKYAADHAEDRSPIGNGTINYKDMGDVMKIVEKSLDTWGSKM